MAHKTCSVLDAVKDYVGAASIAVQIVPIASLNAYQNRWTIKAKVSVRSDMRRWSNAKGEGKFFTVDLLDGQDGEIRAIAFNDQADQFYDLLEPGRVFTISKASLKPKKPGSVSIFPLPEHAEWQQLCHTLPSIGVDSKRVQRTMYSSACALWIPVIEPKAKDILPRESFKASSHSSRTMQSAALSN